MRTRHTMGYDSSASRKLNPDDAPKVTHKDVKNLAAKLGVDARRDGYHGMWFAWDSQMEQWKTLGLTNYIAKRTLEMFYG